MTITAASPVSCPVCKGSHLSIYRLTGLPVIACPSVTPVGDLFAFPALGVLVVGAGEGVDVVTNQKEMSIDDLRAKVADMERATVVKQDEAAEREALKAKLAALEAPQEAPKA